MRIWRKKLFYYYFSLTSVNIYSKSESQPRAGLSFFVVLVVFPCLVSEKTFKCVLLRLRKLETLKSKIVSWLGRSEDWTLLRSSGNFWSFVILLWSFIIFNSHALCLLFVLLWILDFWLLFFSSHLTCSWLVWNWLRTSCKLFCVVVGVGYSYFLSGSVCYFSETKKLKMVCVNFSFSYYIDLSSVCGRCCWLLNILWYFTVMDYAIRY